MVPSGTDRAQLQQRGQPQQPQPGGALLVALENVLARRLLPPPGE